jgi:hypothetical protein
MCSQSRNSPTHTTRGTPRRLGRRRNRQRTRRHEPGHRASRNARNIPCNELWIRNHRI